MTCLSSLIGRIAPLAGEALKLLPPETAHRLTLQGLAAGLGPRFPAPDDPALAQTLWGRRFASPVGLAAGFDKNAEAMSGVLALGPGFLEIGAVTPRPQRGNPKPRVFRLSEDRAIVNRLGFNNQGMEAAARRLRRWREAGGTGIVGVNLGANKDSADRGADFETVLSALWGLCDFYTVNVSSPNTERLRDLQGKEALSALLSAMVARRAALSAASGFDAPILVKIAPDLSDGEIEDVAEAALAAGIDGIVATNTTLERPATLRSPQAAEQGGLSGAPLFDRSTEVLRRLALRTEGKATLIGVGGVETGAQASAKIRAGASLVQLYTGLVYRGPGVFHSIAQELSEILRRGGAQHIGDIIGADLR